MQHAIDQCQATGRLAGESLGDVVGELVGEDGAEHGGAEGAADRAEQRRARGRHSELAVGHGVLDGEDEHLHDEPEAETEHEHVGGGGGNARAGIHQREEVEPDDHDRRADDRVDLVAARACDQLAGADRGDQQASHHRQQLQAGRGRAGTVHDLQKEGQIGDRAEQREPDDQTDETGRGKDAVTEQRKRQHGLGSAPLREHEAA